MKKPLRIVFVLLGAGVVVCGLLFAYREMSGERAREKEREKPVASESKVTRSASGEITITMDGDAQKQLALKIDGLAPAQLEPEVKGYGRVLDPAALSSAVAEFVSARAPADASRKELERLKVLSAQNNASDRAVQAVEAAAHRDAAQAESSRTHLLTTWGKAIADRADLSALIQSLAAGESALVRIDLLAGELLKTQPTGARLFLLSDENNPAEAEFVSSAPIVDAQTQGQGFLFLIKSRPPGFAPGAAILGHLKIAGDAQSGVMIPRGAVVRFNGKPWVYLQTGVETFTRREISEEQPLADGWFATQGMKSGDRVVVSGAQMLLSEEQKYQIHMGD